MVDDDLGLGQWLGIEVLAHMGVELARGCSDVTPWALHHDPDSSPNDVAATDSVSMASATSWITSTTAI